MIRTGIQLTLAGGRASIARLALTVFAITVGVVVLEVVVSIEPAITAREHRLAQREPDPVPIDDVDDDSAAPRLPEDDQTSMAVSESHVGDRPLTIIHLAAGGPAAPAPVGLESVPAPGEVVVSPALRDLLGSSDGDLVRGRLAGAVVDELVRREALVHPRELVAWVGHGPDELAGASGVAIVDGFPLAAPASDWWTNKAAVWVGVILLTLALLVPVLIMVAVLARLGAAEREQRLAILRLVGATPSQTVRLAVIEAATVAVVATALGTAAFYALRPVIADIAFAGARWFPSDFSPHPAALAAVVLAIPTAAAAAAAFTLRRVAMTPLGIQHPDRDPPATRWWPIALLTVGLAGLAATARYGIVFSSGTWAAVAGGSFLALLVGLPTVGPLAVKSLADRLASVVSNAAGMLAANRSSSDPRGVFRGSVGVTIGMFVVTAIYGYTAGNLGTLGPTWFDGTADATVSGLGHPSSDTIDQVASTPGVDQVLAAPRVDGPEPLDVMLATCRQVDTFGLADPQPCPGSGVWVMTDLPRAMRPTPGAAITLTTPDGPASGRVNLPADIGRLTDLDGRVATLVIDPSLVPDDFEAQLEARRVLLDLDDDPATLEAVRNTVIASHPGAELTTPATLTAELDRPLVDARRIVTLAAAITIAITAISLVAAVTGRMLEQRRQLTLLRTIGIPPATLLGAVLIETLLPLSLALITGTAAGLLTASAFVAALGGTYAPPLAAIASIAAAALAAGTALVAATFPAINRATTPRNLRTT